MLTDDSFTLEDPKHTSGRSGRLVLIPKLAPFFATVEKKFDKGWKHPNKPRPPIHAIYKIMWSKDSLEPYKRYRASVAMSMTAKHRQFFGNEKLLFHGTNRCCLLTEDTSRDCLCEIQECHLCRIIQNSFDISKCGMKNKFRRFGTGIYTTSCSSKADDYVVNTANRSDYRVMLVSRVAVGRAAKRKTNATELTGPPTGFHSVIGKPGTHLNFQETVVYSNDAIRPAFLIVYGFAPERKHPNTVKAAITTLFKTPLAS